MTAPNIVNVTTITGKTTGQLVGTTGTAIVSNPAGSGKVLKINALYVSNVDGTNNAEIDAYLYSNELTAGYQVSGTLALSSASSALSGTPEKIDVKGDGTKVYRMDNTKIISEYSLTTANDLSTLNTTATATLDLSATITATFNLYTTMKFFNSGSRIYITNNNNIYQWNLSTPYDLSSASYAGVKTSMYSNTAPGLYIKPDGTKGYIMPDGITSTNQLIEFSMSTAWDITTASLTGITSSALQTRSQGMVIKPDGTLLVVTDTYGSSTSKYFTMSTAFDLSTLSSGTTFSFSTGNTPQDIVFNDDGTYLYGLEGTVVRNYVTQTTTYDQFHIAKTVVVPADATLDVLSKSIYLEEGVSLRLKAGNASDLEAVCSYEEIS